MSHYNAPFEIHVQGQVQLRADVGFSQLQEALKPLWKYAGARSLADGAASAYEEEPGIQFDVKEHVLQMCWTVRGDEDFRQSLDEMCMGINELAEQGAAIEVTFYDTEFDEEDVSSTWEQRGPAREREGARGGRTVFLRWTAAHAAASRRLESAGCARAVLIESQCACGL